jgi:hypothetical protein
MANKMILLMRIISDELINEEGNPDINIEQEDNQNNPHLDEVATY